jgi:hypothetical protein
MSDDDPARTPGGDRASARAIQLRLALAVFALAAGIAALVVAIQLVRSTLG